MHLLKDLFKRCIFFVGFQIIVRKEISFEKKRRHKLVSGKEHIYIQMNDHVRTPMKTVYLKDIASFVSASQKIRRQLEQMILFEFNKEKKIVISILYIHQHLILQVSNMLQQLLHHRNTLRLVYYPEQYQLVKQNKLMHLKSLLLSQ